MKTIVLFFFGSRGAFYFWFKDGKTFRYIKDESELSDYIKKFPHVNFMYRSETEQKKAHNLSELFNLEKLWFDN